MSPHHLAEFFGDGQPEARTLDISVALGVDLIEADKEFVNVLGPDADAAVPDFHTQVPDVPHLLAPNNEAY